MVKKNLTIEDAKIIFRNFAGKEGRYNAKGNRNFCVVLEPEIAQELKEEGWNVKFPQSDDPERELSPYLQVKIKYGDISPKVVLITSRGKEQLTEDDISMLDWAAIETVDLIIRPYNYDVGGKSGVSAYLKSMYVTITEDEFELKYADVPESGHNIYTEDD